MGDGTRSFRTFDEDHNGELLVSVIKHLKLYAQNYPTLHEGRVSDDYVLGPAWAQAMMACRELLGGVTGRIDCTKADAWICRLLREQGFDPDEL